MEEYAGALDGNIGDLHHRVIRGAYRAKPSRRQYIPKPDGRQRPLGIAALEDKIVQRAMVEVLNAIYEVDFLGFSYGFRPGRSQHDALDALAYGITYTKRMKALRFHLIDLPGRVVNHARRLIIRLGAGAEVLATIVTARQTIRALVCGPAG